MLLWFGGTYLGCIRECAGNTFPFPVGAGNTCRDFLFVGGFLDVLPDQLLYIGGAIIHGGKSCYNIRVGSIVQLNRYHGCIGLHPIPLGLAVCHRITS